MLLAEIKLAQNGNQDSILMLVSKFSPLLKKYGRKLGYEDATLDLTADFIEFLSNWNLKNFHESGDGAVVNYIVQSLYRIYLKRLKSCIEEEPRCVSFEVLTPSQLNDLSLDTAVWNELCFRDS